MFANGHRWSQLAHRVVWRAWLCSVYLDGVPMEAERVRRRRPGESGGPAPSALRPSRAPASPVAAQSTAIRRPGDLCSVHAATLSTLSRALRVVFRFSVLLSFPLPHVVVPSLLRLDVQVSTLSRTLGDS